MVLNMKDPSTDLPPPTRTLPLFVRLLLPAVVLVSGVVLAWWLLQTGPTSKPRPKARSATLVEVVPVEFGPQTIRIEAMGKVSASRTVELKPRISGTVTHLHQNLTPGSRLSQGDVLLALDPSDYQLTLRQRESELARAEAELHLEQGNQLIARQEYALLGETVSAEERSLILRQPQLESLQAARDAAQARLDQARLEVQRTTVSAPFNALVETRDVDLGAQVNSGTRLARLVGSDSCWVEVSVPVNQLRWISVPRSAEEPGSRVRVFNPAAWGADVFREGEVISLAAGLEEQGRMARLLVEVQDPLALRPEQAGQPVLLFDSYVRVEIQGESLASAAAIDRQLVRDGAVWIKDDANRLDIRPVRIAFAGRDQVLLTEGLQNGEQLVVTALATPVQGMALRVSTDRPETADPSAQELARP